MTALKNFLMKSMAEINPTLSMQGTSVHNFAEVFLRFLFERACFAYWKIKNNQEQFEGWPESLKMDYFLESVLRDRDAYELSFLHK